MFKINFSYTDEFGQESNLIKDFNEEILHDISTFDLLVEEFKSFLLGSGFNHELVDTIQVVDDENNK